MNRAATEPDEEESASKRRRSTLLPGYENLYRVTSGESNLEGKDEDASKKMADAIQSLPDSGYTRKISHETLKSVSPESKFIKKLWADQKRSVSRHDDEMKKRRDSKKPVKGNDKGAHIVTISKKISEHSETYSRSPTKLSKTKSMLFECNTCHQHFPYPMNLPENHSVALPQCSSHHKTEHLIGSQSDQSPSQKSLNWNILAGSLATIPSYQVYGKTAVKIYMGGDIPIFPKARTMFLHSGNIINWNRLKKKPSQISSDEICEIIGKTLGDFLEREEKTKLQYVTEIYNVNSENIQKLDENEQEEVKITVKLFIFMPQPASVIRESVDQVLTELGINFVDTLLLSVSPVSKTSEDSFTLTVDMIQPYWEAMEELVSAEKVFSLGICDLGKDELMDLYNLAKVKPSIDQVNLHSCCFIPHDLAEYAKSVSVQLLTHNDRSVLISNEELHETIRSVSTEPDSIDWNPQWIVRYSGILKSRSIIITKAYIIHARRGNKKLIV